MAPNPCQTTRLRSRFCSVLECTRDPELSIWTRLEHNRPSSSSVQAHSAEWIGVLFALRPSATMAGALSRLSWPGPFAPVLAGPRGAMTRTDGLRAARVHHYSQYPVIAVFPILANAVDVKRGDQLCETVSQPSIQPDKAV